MLRPRAENTDHLGYPPFRPIPDCSTRDLDRRRWAILCAFALAFACQPVPAADGSSSGVTEDTFLADMPVVLSATRLLQPANEIPASITVISREMIEATGAFDLPQVLRLVPGFQVGHINGNTTANSYTVTYHGLSDDFARRMQVLVDGRSVYTPAFGGMDWAALPLPIEDIDRIEVIRGPNGVTYGANSFAAVINIITRHPVQDQGTNVQYTGGDIDMKRVIARHGASSGNLTYHLTAGYRQDSGFKTVRPDAQQFTTLTYNGNYIATDNDELDLHLGYKDGQRGRGDYDDDTGLRPPRKEDVTEHFQQVRWRHTIDNRQETSLQVYHNYHRGIDTVNTPPLSQLLSQLLSTTITPAQVPAYLASAGLPPLPDQSLTYDQSITTERFDLEFQHTLSPYTDWRFVWGAESRLDRVKSEGYFNTSSYVDSRLYRIFGNAEWRLARDWVTNIGAMYEHNSITGGDVSPRFGLNWHVTSTDTLRASVSRAYRTPSMIESAADAGIRASDGTLLKRILLSTRQLEPERITSYELGYLGEFPSLNTNLDVKLFREQIRNVIAYVSDANNLVDPVGALGVKPDALTFVNDGRADINGVELQAKFQVLPTTMLHFAQAYASQHGHYLTNATTGTSADSDTSTPKWTTSAILIQRFPDNFEASAMYYRVSQMHWVGQDSPDNQIQGFRTLDLRLAKKLRVGNLKGELSLVGRNLLGKYFDFDANNVLGVRYFVTLRLGAR